MLRRGSQAAEQMMRVLVRSERGTTNRSVQMQAAAEQVRTAANASSGSSANSTSAAPECGDAGGLMTMNAYTRGKPGGRRPERLRSAGYVPAMLFSQRKHKDKHAIAVPLHELNSAVNASGSAMHFCASLLHLRVDGNTPARVMAQQLHMHTLTEAPTNVTFMRCPVGATVRVAVPIIPANEDASPGVRKGGFVNMLKRVLVLRGDADAMPSSLELDASVLDNRRHGYVSDLHIPDGVKVVRHTHSQPIARIAGRSRRARNRR